MNAAVAAPIVSTPTLEPAAQAFADATSKAPFLFDLPPAEGRKAVDDRSPDSNSQPLPPRRHEVRRVLGRSTERHPAHRTGRAQPARGRVIPVIGGGA
jgi:hypothetical protein